MEKTVTISSVVVCKSYTDDPQSPDDYKKKGMTLYW